MKAHLLIKSFGCTLTFFASMAAAGQSGVRVEHALENACNGNLRYYNEQELVDSVVWSTGYVGWNLTDVPPGTYGYELFLDGSVVAQGSREVELVGWEFSTPVPAYHSPDEFNLSGTLSVPYCFGQIFTGLCCHPDPAVTSLLILQDGEPFPLTNENCEFCESVDCISAIYMANLPYGHVYDIGVDDPTCSGVIMMDQVITAYSCANLELVTEVEDDLSGGSTGSILVTDVIPDPAEPLPVPAPVNGTFTLFNNQTEEVVGAQQTGTYAEWTGLPVGEYRISFTPDLLCQPASRLVSITDGAGIGEGGTGVLDLYPRIAEDHIVLTSTAGAIPVDVHVVDLNGREVVSRQAMSPGRIPLAMLAPGQYVLIAHQGEEELRARFIKR